MENMLQLLCYMLNRKKKKVQKKFTFPVWSHKVENAIQARNLAKSEQPVLITSAENAIKAVEASQYGMHSCKDILGTKLSGLNSDLKCTFTN